MQSTLLTQLFAVQKDVEDVSQENYINCQTFTYILRRWWIPLLNCTFNIDKTKFKSFIVKKQLPLIAESFILSNYNPGQTFLGQCCNIHSFLSFLGSLLKQCILFEIFLQFSLPHPIQNWNSEKILDTRVQHCLWGKGRGWACVNWKTPRKRKSVPRLLSMIVGLLSLRLRSHYTGKYIRGGTSRSHTWNLVSARLAERVWCTKFQSSLLNIYFRLSGFQSTLLIIHFHNRSCVWTEALSYKTFVAAQQLSGMVWR